MEAVAALSEVAENLRESEGRRLSKEQFEDALRKYLSGSHAEQQILQLWDKACVAYNSDMITRGRGS